MNKVFVHTQNSTFNNKKSPVDFHWFHGSSNLHAHAYFELFVIIDGHFKHTYKNKTISLTNGQAVLITPNVPHLLTADSHLNLHANFSITEREFKNLTEKYDPDFYEYLIKNSGKPFLLDEKTLSIIVDLLNLGYYSNYPQTIDYLYLSIIHLLLGVFHISANSVANDLPMPEWLRNFVFKLSSPSVFTLPLKEIYRLSNYSQSRFITLFKHYLNTTPINYINNLKIDYAKKLLAKTNYELIFISNEVGFSSYSYFVTFFKKRTGLSPSEYREKEYIPKELNP